jgi:hypothetical protein
VSIALREASARDIEASRNRRAAAEAIGSPVRGDGGEREEAAGAGLGRFDRPRPEPGGLTQPGGLGGLASLLGQQARWASLVLANGFRNKILNFKF